jgi:protein-tyrosine sulfotransferase
MEHKGPIFIQGMMKRCGTNFLRDLVCLHPDCVSTVISENFFLESAGMLEKYVGDTKARMVVEGDPEGRARIKERLHEYIGEGLIRFLWSPRAERAEEGKRVVAKTPSVKNLGSFFDLFPGGQMIIIVRDGRAAIESYVRSYGWTNYEFLMRRWAEAARVLVEFCSEPISPERQYLIVKYEDLYGDTEKEMKRILAFLGLDPAVYDFSSACSLPVRGSSVFRGIKRELHWEPVARTPEFEPSARADGWGQSKRERFNWIAGRGMKELGYGGGKNLKGGFSRKVRNVIMDLAWEARMGIKKAAG